MIESIDELADVSAGILSGWIALFMGTLVALTVGNGMLNFDLETVATNSFLVAIALLGLVGFRLAISIILSLLRMNFLYMAAAAALLIVYGALSISPLAAIWLYEYFSGLSVGGENSWYQWLTGKVVATLVFLDLLHPFPIEDYVSGFERSKLWLSVGSLVFAAASQFLLSASAISTEEQAN